jgi:hypothetical protein
MNKRNLVLDDYGISSKRYKELCGFCEQYPEWKSILENKNNTLKSKVITDMPITFGGKSDQTCDLVIKRIELQKKCELIENTAKEASNDLWTYIIDSVCYEFPLSYLQTIRNMPCSRASFYDARRYFFFLLDKYK